MCQTRKEAQKKSEEKRGEERVELEMSVEVDKKSTSEDYLKTLETKSSCARFSHAAENKNN